MSTLKTLKPNPKNPRVATDQKLSQFREALKEFGDLGGIVYNRKSKNLVGGTQRSKMMPDAKIVILRRYSPPTRTGTVAIGYVLYKGERFGYREVEWSSSREKAASIAANKNVGEWDMSALGTWLKELDGKEFDMSLTMFDEEELSTLLADPDFEAGKSGDQSKLDEKSKTVCPHCGEAFLVGGRK